MDALALGGLTETGLLLARTGHADAVAACLLLGVKRTSRLSGSRSVILADDIDILASRMRNDMAMGSRRGRQAMLTASKKQAALRAALTESRLRPLSTPPRL
jgi:hypothetical protein